MPAKPPDKPPVDPEPPTPDQPEPKPEEPKPEKPPVEEPPVEPPVEPEAPVDPDAPHPIEPEPEPEPDPVEPLVPPSAPGNDKGADEVAVDLDVPWETADIDGKEPPRPPEPIPAPGVSVFVVPSLQPDSELLLGRHIEHDVKSLEFPARALVPAQTVQRNRLWTHRGKILDQRPLSASTGYAAVACLMTSPHWVKGRTLGEEEALAIYSKATSLDRVSGEYPPVDTGSTGLGACKALVAMGYIEAYRWAFGWDEAQMVLSAVGPLMAGIPWYEGFDQPGKHGLVQIAGDKRGGHEVALVGIDYDAQLVRAVNSWGVGWGDKGFFSVTFADMRRLLQEQGDLALPVPPTATPKAA